MSAPETFDRQVFFGADACLALEDGRVFFGRAFGSGGEAEAEVVFNTSMAGYQEIATDPSYHGQMVVLTHPQIGNYGVQAEATESKRPWIAAFPECPALNQYRIVHVGIMGAAAPTRIVRTKQTTAYFLACFGGKGKVLIDGRWRVCGAGSACLLPAHTLNAFEAVPGIRWEFCWGCYQQPAGQRPIADAASPVMARFAWLPWGS